MDSPPKNLNSPLKCPRAPMKKPRKLKYNANPNIGRILFHKDDTYELIDIFRDTFKSQERIQNIRSQVASMLLLRFEKYRGKSEDADERIKFLEECIQK